jgi:hypothetical protein
MPLLQKYRANPSGEKKAVIGCLSVLESYLVRRGFSGMQSAGFQTLFKSMWKNCEKKADPSKLFGEISSRAGYDFPDDDAFGLTIEKSKLFTKKQLCRYVLNELELSQDAVPGHVNFVLDQYLSSTAEHIIPQEAENWVADAASFEMKEKDFLDWSEEVKDTFGNLTLLLSYENAKIGNKRWTDKSKFYQDEAKYFSPRTVAKQFPNKFGPDEYKDRVHDLKKWSTKRWPYPKL